MGRVWCLAVVLAACGNDGVVPADAPIAADGGPARLVAMPTSVDFAGTAVSLRSAPSAVVFTNLGGSSTGTLTATITPSTAGTAFTILSSTCFGMLLAPGGACTASIVFGPTVVGTHTATLALTDGATSASVELGGAALGLDSLSISGGPIDFGSITVGQTSAMRSFTVTNIGGVTSGMVSVTPTGANVGDFVFGGTCAGAMLPAGMSCTVTAQFHPTAAGMRIAEAEITVPNGNGVLGTVIGTGVLAPVLAITPAFIEFGYVQPGPHDPTTQPRTFTITNTGSAAATALVVQISGSNASEFTAGGTCAGVALAVNASCDVAVTFDASGAGSQYAVVDVTAANHGALQGQLSGSCCAPGTVVLNPPSKDFGSVTAGTISAAQQFTVTNVSGSAQGPITIGLAGPDAGEFHVDATTCGPPLGPVIGTCTIDATFRPLSAGQKTAILHLALPTGTAWANLSGTGTP